MSVRVRNAGAALARGWQLDPALAVLHFKVGRYPVHHGALAVVRSLGREGVRVTAMTEDRYTPVALSRYLDRPIYWTPDVWTDPDEMLVKLIAVGKSIGGRPMIICTDDEAAVFVAEAQAVLGEQFTLPSVAPDLPRQLASKHGLYDLCRKYDMPTPETHFLSSRSELAEAVDQFEYPVVVKNIDPWTRIRNPAVGGTTIIRSAEELLSGAKLAKECAPLLLQQYLPASYCEDWVIRRFGNERGLRYPRRETGARPI